MATTPIARPAKARAAANTLVVAVAVTAGLVLTNVIASRFKTAKLDLTSGGQYTLTGASKKMVRDLPETLHVTAYFGHVPADQYYLQEFVETTLEEYAEASGGKLTWKKVDPFEEGREFQKKLEEDGIQKLSMLSGEDDAPKQEPVYFHIQFQYLDKKQVWAPRGNVTLSGLEYVFSSLIRQVAYPRKKVAVTTGSGEPPQAQAITQFLSDLYDVEPVDLSKEPIDLSSYDVVIVNGPAKPLSQAALLALDQHVMAGKPMLLLHRGMAWQSGGDPNMPPEMQQGEQPFVGSPIDDGLGPMLAHWGIIAGADVVIDGTNATTGVIPMGREPLLTKAFFPLAEVLPEARGALPGLRMVPLPFTSTLSLTGELAKGSTPTMKVTPLLRTFPTSFRRADLVPVTRETTLRPQGDKGPYVVGYALEGSFTSFLADDKPPGDPAADGPMDLPDGQTPSSGQQSPPDTRVIVLGSADFINDAYMQLAQRYPMFQVLGAGRLVLADLVDWLAEDQALLGARTKEAPRPLQPLERAKRLKIQWGNLAGAPLLLILVGVIGWRIRERRRRHIVL